jgi:serine/threonine protein phosphatase PrpC
MLEEVKKELQARGLSLGQAQGPAPAAASPPPMAKRDDASDEVEFELTLEVGPSANSSDPNTLRAKLADAAPEESVFGEESGEGKDIFETDFEVPAIDEDSASQAVTMEGSNTDLESSDFDLGVKLDKEAPRESLAVFSEVDSLEEEQNEADDSAALYRSMPAPKKPTPPAPRGKAAATPPTPPQKQNLRKSVRRLDETGPGKGESLWDKVKKAADGVRKALTSPAADERQVRRATPPSMRAIPAPRVPPPPVSSPPPPPDQPGDEIRRLTIDHSLAQALVETRSITPEEAVDHKFKNVLWKYLGSKEVGDGPDVIEVPLAAGDRFLLCSDGLSGSVADDNLLGFIAGQADVQTCADGLGKLALDSGSRDNVSCIVIEVARNGSLNIGKCTLLGNYRENNEDSIEVKQLQDWTICLVADGMGGQAAGEIASKRALEVILRELRQHLPMAATSDQARSVIRKAVFQANAEILAMGDLDRALKNMGTTIVLTAWRKGAPVIYVTNLGDSRCYHIPRARGGASVAAPSRSAAPSSYADRARRLADDLTRDLLGDDADRVHRLGILAVKLAELVEDLRSVGVPEAECRPLAQTVVFLKSFVGRAAVSREEVAQAVASTEQVLRDFAGPGEVVSTAPAMVAATSQSREAFWK